MPVKIARSAPRPSFGLPELLVAIHTSRQSCCKAGKARIFTPVRESSGESRFHKCDLQVHTPRDQQWSGPEAVTESERKNYAEELILACRQKGLGAIAITDHHDLAFFPYIKEAAQNELDDAGQPVPEAKRIVVYPGIELTLTSPTCRALLIVDADFPENLFQSVLTTLAITPAPAGDSKTAQVQRVPQNVVGDLKALYDKLESHQHLKGRFIVFPNVSDSGYDTLLRSGFANFYKTMPCCGGYAPTREAAMAAFAKSSRRE